MAGFPSLNPRHGVVALIRLTGVKRRLEEYGFSPQQLIANRNVCVRTCFEPTKEEVINLWEFICSTQPEYAPDSIGSQALNNTERVQGLIPNSPAMSPNFLFRTDGC